MRRYPDGMRRPTSAFREGFGPKEFMLVCVLCFFAGTFSSKAAGPDPAAPKPAGGFTTGDAADNLLTKPAVESAVAPRPVGFRSLEISEQHHGHFVVRAKVRPPRGRPGVPEFTFLVDTGATFVVFGRDHMDDLGLRQRDFTYTVPLATANGRVGAAHLVLPEIRIGNLKLDNVAAVIIDSDLGMPLLGSSFLNALRSYKVEDGRLVMSW